MQKMSIVFCDNFIGHVTRLKQHEYSKELPGKDQSRNLLIICRCSKEQTQRGMKINWNPKFPVIWDRREVLTRL